MTTQAAVPFQVRRGSTEAFSPMMASNQWANRPDDERFESSQALKQFLTAEAALTRDVKVDLSKLSFNLSDSGSPRLTSKGDGGGAFLSHLAFQQFGSMAGLPVDYLRTIGKPDSQLLLDNLSFGLKRLVEAKDSDNQRRFLARVGPESSVIRAINGQNFGRIMDLDMIDRIIEMESRGWRVPPARPVRDGQPGTRIATEHDVLRGRGFALSINIGDEIAPAGTYYGDRSSFYIRVNEERTIEVRGQQLFEMVIVQNSEVGSGFWEIFKAWIVGICGNHILHGVQDLKALKVRHVGRAKEKAEIAFSPDLVEEGEDTRQASEQQFYKATQKVLGVGRVEVVEELFGKRIAPKKTLEAAWVAADRHESWYGAPNTAWGMASGLTEVSQESRWQDKRQEIDEAAAKVLRLAGN